MLKPSESDAKKQLPLTLLVNQMIDLATDHANLLGIGFLNLESKGLGWVLSRIAVEMSEWPKTGEKYILKTWIESWNRHYSERCFSVVTMDGKTIGLGRTIWVIINLDTHSSVGTAGIELPETKIAGLECPISRIQRHKPYRPELETVYTFKYTDLDFYRHVNTIRYLSLLLNQFSLEEMDANLISRLEVSFQHEAKFGQKAIIKSITEDIETSKALFLMQKDNTSKRHTFEISVDSNPILSASIILTPL